MRALIIGAGGVGSWLTPALCKLIKPHNVIVIDGDYLEEKNLDRQLYSRSHLGRSKASSLASIYNCGFFDEFYSMGRYRVTDEDWLMVCADNHPARRAALNEADARQCHVIVAANEVHSAEAYYYTPGWRGSILDPREYYPEILSDHTGDPMAEAIGCTGEAQEATPQLVSANYMAAALALHLFVVWALEAPGLEPETLEALPFKLVSNLSKLESVRVKDAPQIERTVTV